MTDNIFKNILLALAILFTLAFCTIVLPPLLSNPDIINAFASGFVNPYATGYSLDVFFCWAILAVWVKYEAKNLGVKHGWICLLLGVVPGVAVGFAFYLILRTGQIKQSPKT